jgi:hypothetical protein
MYSIKGTLLSILLIRNFAVDAQNYVWAQDYLSGIRTVNVITTDDSANVYVGGTNRDEFNFFIDKTDPSGQLIWSVSLPSDDSYWITDVKAAKDSNKIFCATSSIIYTISQSGISQQILWVNQNIGNIAIQNSSLYFTLFSANEGGGLYIGDTAYANVSGFSLIVKYDLNTDRVVWIKPLDQTAGINSLSAMKLDTAGNIFICGSIGTYISPGGSIVNCPDTTIFGDTILICHGFSNGFVAKFDSTGNFVWVKDYGTSGTYYSVPGMSIDSQQQIYFSVQSNTAASPTALVKLNNNGQEIWNKRYWHKSNWSSITCAQNNIYVAGNDWNISNDTLNLNGTVLTNSFNNYVVCLDTGGNFSWISVYPENPMGLAYITNIAAAKNGLVYSAGVFQGSVNIGNSFLLNSKYPVMQIDGPYFQYLALLYDNSVSSSGNAAIKGRIYFDNNDNCIFDSGDSAAKYFGIIATPGNYITTSDSNGFYSLIVPADSYVVNEILPYLDAGSITQVCPGNMHYTTGPLTGNEVDTAYDFSNRQYNCEYTKIFAPEYYQYVKCDTTFTIPLNFCNYTSIVSDSIILKLDISDSVSFINTNPPFDYRDSLNNSFIFQNFILPADTCIEILVSGLRMCNNAELLGAVNFYPFVISAQVPESCVNSINTDSFNLSTNFTDISNLPQEISLKIYPNPFQDVLFIQLSGSSENGILTLYDIFDREIKSLPVKYLNKTSINLDFLSKGAYVLNFQSSEGFASRLIIKQ